MVKISEEKRSYPRTKTNLKLNISKNIYGDSIDLSESGLSFSCTETISSPTISLEIRFPDIRPEFATKAKLIWKRDLEGGTSLYGVQLVNLNESQKITLRKELIKAQIDGLLSGIKNHEIKKEISRFFLKDMLEYINEINRFSSRLSKEDQYSEELQKKLELLNTKFLLKGYCLEELLSDKINIQRVKDNFRQLVGAWVYKSAFMKRAFEKPEGYAGDYKILEIIYDNKPISKKIGLYFDNYFLKSPYAVAVRTRKDRLRELLQNYINETELNRINILNIDCGSCREIRELLSSLKTRSFITFACLDRDEGALRFSQDMLYGKTPKNVEFKFAKEDIMNLIKNEDSLQLYGKQNLIYSLGLIDYLPDELLKKLIRVLYQLLREGGEIILTHKNKDKTFPPIIPDWLCDWKFVPRNKEEVVKLFYNCGLSKFLLSMESDDFSYIYFFTITKRQNGRGQITSDARISHKSL